MLVGLVVQRGSDRALSVATRLRDRLRGLDAEVLVDETTAVTLDHDRAAAVDSPESSVFRTCDLLVSVGGDGTFLLAARAADGVPILGVNLGEVGFLNSVAPENAADAVARAVADYRTDDLAIREITRLVGASEGWTGTPATNEVVIHGPRRGHGSGVDATVRIDGECYSSSHADGVLVATPVGSTAYNLSERGPLVHPDAEGIVVTEIGATEGMPSLVVSPDAEVIVELTGEGATVFSDGRPDRTLDLPTSVRVSTTDVPTRIVGRSGEFFDALDKLA